MSSNPSPVPPDEVEKQLKSFMKGLGKDAQVRKKTIIEVQNEPCRVIGIDLGTATSCAAVWKNGEVKIITVMGKRTLPSVVGYVYNSKERERIVGEQALKKILGTSKSAKKQVPNTIYEVKRLIGKKIDDPAIQQDIKNWPFKVVADKETNNALVQVTFDEEPVTYTPEEVSANILIALKKAAELFLDAQVEGAVITVPAYFTDQQRQATIHAGHIAGLDVKAIINEPTAAALAYAFLEHKTKEAKHTGKQNLFIFDLGGGTFDVTILQHDHGFIEVLSTAGDGHLGGVDIDHRIAQHFDSEFFKKHGFSAMKKDLAKMVATAKEVKHELSEQNSAHFSIEVGEEEFESELTRTKFEQMCVDLFGRCVKIMEEALKNSKLSKEDIDEVILIGGSTNIPYVRELVKNFFNGKRIKADISADEAVAMGAAIRAAAMALPPKQKKGTLLEDVKIIDVTPVNIGIKIQGGLMHVLVPGNSQLPFISQKMRFKTTLDNQTSTDIELYEGSHEQVAKNKLLGKFKIQGFPERKAGEVKIYVEVKVDTNGVLDVMASPGEDSDWKSEQVKIDKNKGILSQQQVEQKREETRRVEKKQSDKQLTENAVDNLQRLCQFLKSSAKLLPNQGSVLQLKTEAETETDRVEKYLEEMKGNYLMQDLLLNMTTLDNILTKVRDQLDKQ